MEITTHTSFSLYSPLVIQGRNSNLIKILTDFFFSKGPNLSLPKNQGSQLEPGLFSVILPSNTRVVVRCPQLIQNHKLEEEFINRVRSLELLFGLFRLPLSITDGETPLEYRRITLESQGRVFSGQDLGFVQLN